MRDELTDRYSHRSGPADEVLTHFGVSRQGFVDRLREILLDNPPPKGLDDRDVAYLLAACS